MFPFIYVMAMVFTISHIQISRAVDCGVNEKNVECARDISCQPTCNKPQGTACPRTCDVTSCECQDGYIRTSKDNQTCIAIRNCKQLCGENEQYDTCANPCQPSCQEPDRQPCPTFTCSKGCACREGYLRVSNSANSACIKCDIINTF